MTQRELVVARQGEQFLAADGEFAKGLRTLPDLVEDRLELESVRIEGVANRFSLLHEIAFLQVLTGNLQLEAALQNEPVYGPSE